MTAVIKNTDEITTEWIEGVLREQLQVGSGSVSDYQITRQWDTPMTHVARIEIKYRETKKELPGSLFLKLDKSGTQNDFNRFGEHEVQFYNTLASEISSTSLLKCYRAVYDENTKVSNLVLEDLSESHGNDEFPLPPRLRQFEMAIDSLSHIHSAWWDHPELSRLTKPYATRQQTEERYRFRKNLVDGFIPFIGDRLPEKRRRLFYEFLDHHDLIFEHGIREKGVTLIHGDAYSKNFLFPRAEDDDAKIVDWASYGIQVASADLATMIALHCHPQHRREIELPLLKRYHRNLTEFGVGDYTFDQLLDDYRLSIVGWWPKPLGGWKYQVPAYIWWGHLECLCSAVEDLRCLETLRDRRG